MVGPPSHVQAGILFGNPAKYMEQLDFAEEGGNAA